MTPTWVALITGIASAIAVMVAAWFAFSAKRNENMVNGVGQIMGGYDQMVHTLQAEIQRLENKIEKLHVEQVECERRNDEMQAQIEVLKSEIATWKCANCG
jgi:peptidoglycan hydrolase CwlO-like protein